MLRPPRLGVVADELLASSNIGARFARRAWATRLFTADAELESLPDRLRNRCTDVVVVHTDARFYPPDEAAERVRRATQALVEWGADIYYNETCLAGPGVVGEQFDTMLAGLGHAFGLVVVALPRHGHLTLDGLCDGDGRLRTAVPGGTGTLPIEVVRQGSAAVRAHLDEARNRHVRYLTADVQTPDDLVALAQTLTDEPVLLGSSGLIEELAAHYPAPAASADFDPFEGLRPGAGGGVLVIAGSVVPEVHVQVDALVAAGATVLTLTADQALDGRIGPVMSEVAIRLGRNETVVVRPETGPEGVAATCTLAAERGHEADVARRIVGETLAAFTEAATCRLIVLGGDTCAAVCRHLGANELVVLDEIVPGLPATYTPRPRPLLLVLKNGGFGGPSFLIEAIAHLNRYIGPPVVTSPRPAAPGL